MTANPREAIGGNLPPANQIIEEITAQLAVDYGELATTAFRLLDKASDMPEEVETESDLERFSNVVVEMRDAIARAEATRIAEKEPHFRRAQAVDGWFGGLKERLDKGMKVLQRRVNDYQRRKLAAEQERRRLEAEERERIARIAREQAEKERREAEEAHRAAERARKPEAKVAKEEVASEQSAVASHATQQAQIASAEAEAARIETLRKPSEIARSRFDEGRLVTMKQVGYAEVLDAALLDKEALWPFVHAEAINKALRAWARTQSFKKPMAGAIVEMRDEAVIR
jgi:hypothetical protein